MRKRREGRRKADWDENPYLKRISLPSKRGKKNPGKTGIQARRKPTKELL